MFKARSAPYPSGMDVVLGLLSGRFNSVSPSFIRVAALFISFD